MPLRDTLSRLKLKKNRTSLPPQPSRGGNLGGEPTSTITSGVSTGTASSSWNSDLSLPTNSSHRRGVSVGHVPENPDDIRIPTELAANTRHRQWSQQFSATPQSLGIASQPPPQYEVFNSSQQLGSHDHLDVSEDAVIIAQTREKDRAIAQQSELEREQNASAEAVRKLRELMRQKYALDLYLWSKRRTPAANRKKLIPKCEEADRLYQEIVFIVSAWEEDQFDAEEWELVKNIRSGLVSRKTKTGASNEPAYWMSLKPWERMVEPTRS